MKVFDVTECAGRVVKGVNTTVDVGENEIMDQAKKFGNNVDQDGRPPTINSIHKLGLSESVLNENSVSSSSSLTLSRIKEASYEGNIGAMEVMKFFMISKTKDIKLHDFVKRLSDSDASEDNKLAWRIIQNFLGVHLKGKGFGNV